MVNGSPRFIMIWIRNWLVRSETSQLLFVERVLNPTIFSTRVSRRSLVEAEVTCVLLLFQTSPISVLITFGIQRAGSVS